jgi:hypothetical protein
MTRWFPPQITIVHGRQIIVNQNLWWCGSFNSASRRVRGGSIGSSNISHAKHKRVECAANGDE